MTLQQRRIFVQLDLYTDAPLESIIDPEHWRALLRGKNPSWVQEGREAVVRIQAVTCERDPQSIEAAMRKQFDQELEMLTISLNSEINDLKVELEKAKKAPSKPKVGKKGKAAPTASS